MVLTQSTWECHDAAHPCTHACIHTHTYIHTYRYIRYIRMHACRRHTEQEEVEVEVIRRLVESYFGIVRRNLMDSVPKAIMHFMVNNTKRGLQQQLIQQLYRCVCMCVCIYVYVVCSWERYMHFMANNAKRGLQQALYRCSVCVAQQNTCTTYLTSHTHARTHTHIGRRPSA